MKKLKLFSVLALACMFSFSSCSKDDENTGVTEGKMTSTIDGKSVDFTIGGVLVKVTDSNQTYENLVITGNSGTSAADLKTFIITVNASKIVAKTYTVPAFTDNYIYNNETGFAMAEYISGTAAQSVTYASFELKNSTGSVTIESISATNAKGSYDMTLTNYMDISKTMKFKGSFNAKIVTYSGK